MPKKVIPKTARKGLASASETKINSKKQKPPTKKAYSLLMEFNGLTFRKRTNNLEEAILSLTPEWLQTEVYVTLKQGKETSVRKLNLLQGKKLFRDEVFLQVFLNNLLVS